MRNILHRCPDYYAMSFPIRKPESFQKATKICNMESFLDSDTFCSAPGRLKILQLPWLRPGYITNEHCRRVIAIDQKTATEQASYSQGRQKSSHSKGWKKYSARDCLLRALIASQAVGKKSFILMTTLLMRLKATKLKFVGDLGYFLISRDQLNWKDG